MTKVTCAVRQKFRRASGTNDPTGKSTFKEEVRGSEKREGPTFELTVLREEDAEAARSEFRKHVVDGLSKPTKSISSKYFYDDRGSEIYARITELEEYYLTRTEKEIFETYSGKIVDAHLSLPDQDEPINIVELGAGDGRKTKILLEALLARNVKFEYIPIDISRQAMSDLFEAMGSFFQEDHFKIHGIVGDFLESVLHVISLHPSRRTAVLFIGSSLGNFSIHEGTVFLKSLFSNLNSRDLLLLGLDLRKDLDTMRRAYSDSKGVTRDFNLNLLTRMNRELGTNFDRKNFQHRAVYNQTIGAMESYLVATKSHNVRMVHRKAFQTSLEGHDVVDAISREFRFEAFEPIYTECSHKYTESLAAKMLSAAGFELTAKYLDRRGWFLDAVAEVP